MPLAALGHHNCLAQYFTGNGNLLDPSSETEGELMDINETFLLKLIQIRFEQTQPFIFWRMHISRFITDIVYFYKGKWNICYYC